MTAPLSTQQAAELLFHEAALLDSGAWREWLDLYTEDAVYWMPAWKDELTPTSDPDRELSLIYYAGRAGLEDRVQRASGGQSIASSPRPRCLHMISNVRVLRQDDSSAEVESAFCVHLHDVRLNRTHSFFGRYSHRLVPQGGQWLIAAKTIFLLNDQIPTVVDFYSI